MYVTSLVAQRVKRLPTMWKTWVRSLGQEDPLKKEMVAHTSVLAWRIPWTEEPGGLQSMGSQRGGHDWATSLLSLSCKYYNTVLLCSDCFGFGHWSWGRSENRTGSYIPSMCPLSVVYLLNVRTSWLSGMVGCSYHLVYLLPPCLNQAFLQGAVLIPFRRDHDLV